MELGLSLGDSSVTPLSFLSKTSEVAKSDLGFLRKTQEDDEDGHVQLDLLPFSHVLHRHRSSQLCPPWLTHNLNPRLDSLEGLERKPEVKWIREGKAAADEVEARASPSSPNSGVSYLEMDFGIKNGGKRKRQVEEEEEEEETEKEKSSRGSHDDLTRKKLRLTKDQSAFLDECFKHHSTLNPKRKHELAKQLNLRPRQIEVWFQNRRARTKLKQSEVDCEYLKRCCETLRVENKRLQKELEDLRTLRKTQPFFMQLPSTTLTLCPSCESVAASSSTAVTTATTTTDHLVKLD